MARKSKAPASGRRRSSGRGHSPPSDGEPLSGQRHLADGHSDHLQPVRSLDLSQVESVDDLVRAMAATSVGGRTVGEAADILERMVRDEGCKVVRTLSGARGRWRS